MVALAVLLGVLGLGAFLLHRIAAEWGDAERSFWDCVLALGAARIGSRALKLIPGLHAPELIALGFGVYALVLVVFVGAIVATAMLVASEPE